MAARKPAPSIPTLPVREGQAYAAEELAPVVTAMLASAGIPKSVSGLDIRNVVRGKRKGIVSPVPRLLVKPVFGNRAHDYTLTEAADVLRCFMRLAGLPERALPSPFAGHESGARVTRPRTPKNTRVNAQGARTRKPLPPADTSALRPTD